MLISRLLWQLWTQAEPENGAILDKCHYRDCKTVMPRPDHIPHGSQYPYFTKWSSCLFSKIGHYIQCWNIYRRFCFAALIQKRRHSFSIYFFNSLLHSFSRRLWVFLHHDWHYSVMNWNTDIEISEKNFANKHEKRTFCVLSLRIFRLFLVYQKVFFFFFFFLQEYCL